jgi:predicted alpha/beta hydrolase
VTDPAGQAAGIPCLDGVRLGGHLWRMPGGCGAAGTVIVNPATGVLARYYHRYARFLATHGFNVLTYDYRGMGAPAWPQSLADAGAGPALTMGSHAIAASRLNEGS